MTSEHSLNFLLETGSAIYKNDLNFIEENIEKYACTCKKYNQCIITLCVHSEKYEIASYLIASLENNDCDWYKILKEQIFKNPVISNESAKLYFEHGIRNTDILKHCCKDDRNLNFVKVFMSMYESISNYHHKSIKLHIEYLDTAVSHFANKIARYILNLLHKNNFAAVFLEESFCLAVAKQNKFAIKCIIFMYRKDLRSLQMFSTTNEIVNRQIVHEIVLTLTIMLHKFGLSTHTPIMERIIECVTGKKSNSNYLVMKISEIIANIISLRN